MLISKDTDFYHSHLLKKGPWKLVLVRTGNISVGELTGVFSRNLSRIEWALKTHSLLELDRAEVRVVM